MAAQEERILRNVWTKCTEVEARGYLLEGLLAKGVGTREVMEYVKMQEKKLKLGGVFKDKNRIELIKISMKEKVSDNNQFGINIRKRRAFLRRKFEVSVGAKSRTYRRIIKDIRMHCENLRNRLKSENEKTISFLVRKYGKTNDAFVQKCPDEIKRYASAKVFMDNCDLVAEALKGPVIVVGDDEALIIDEYEKDVLGRRAARGVMTVL